ncbi:STAS domain-containing protein [Allostreptomyces psammosilenae]|uniref:Anti-sigma factor antagonist n=1 Tax=Allostreptomyces psammosilenae TaxID=1892865 RepID=A0A852ZWK8_9ACTN|nr:STAS domain-containing protein [Allostreptomyces psammosilenae]NYI06355.1 anti-anti-sigma factor [Allostreptomyces psammosilenae]
MDFSEYAPVLDLRRLELDGSVVLAVRGDLDLDTVPELRDGITQCLAHRPTVIIVDLHDVGFMDSAGLGTLLECHRRASSVGVRLRVASASPLILRVLRMTGTAATLGVE